MTTTAHDDQYTSDPEPLRQPYDTVAILRRNVADLEIALRKQTERAESYAETLRSIASYVGAGGYNADTVDAGVFEEKIRWGIGEIMERTESAEAELVKLRGQKPTKYLYRVTDCFGHDVLRDDPKGATILETIPLFAAPVPAPHKGATHCDDCGLTWLDDGLNPLRCPYCKDHIPAPAVPATCKISLQVAIREMLQWLIDQRGKHGHNHKQSGIWDDDNGAMAGKPCEACAMYDKARALLQSAEVTDNAAADRLLESGE